MKKIAIFGQTDEQGILKRGSLELISLAKKMSIDEGLSVILFGDTDMPAVEMASVHGANQVIVIKKDTPACDYPLKPYAKALVKLIDQSSYDVVLFSATAFGRDLAPYVASIGGLSLMSYCLDANLTDMGKILWAGAAFGGSLRTKASFSGGGAQLVTVRPGLFPLPEETKGSSTQVIEKDFYSAGDNLISLIEILKKQEIVDLESADVVVAGGKGTGGEKGFALIKELADAFGGVVGASRQAVDRGWIGHEHLVGQSGKIISPKLYIACGIAGYVQHLTGMRDSGYIVAINTDPRALIYDVADVCVVGDLFEVLPPLITEVKKIRG